MSIVQSFNAEIRDFARKVAPEEAVQVQRKIAIEALKRLVMKTPVRTGRARGNWQVGINTDPEGWLETFDKAGGGTINLGAAQIHGMPLGTCFLTNNVNYIEDLEHGKSTQAPHGMLTVTVEELKGLFP